MLNPVWKTDTKLILDILQNNLEVFNYLQLNLFDYDC